MSLRETIEARKDQTITGLENEIETKDKRIAELETQLSDIRKGLYKLGKTIAEASML